MGRRLFAFLAVLLLASGCAEPEAGESSRYEIVEISNQITMTDADEVTNVSFEDESLVVRGQIVTQSHGMVPVVSNFSSEGDILRVTVGTVEGKGPTGVSESEASIYRLEVDEALNASRLVVIHDANVKNTVFNETISDQ